MTAFILPIEKEHIRRFTHKAEDMRGFLAKFYKSGSIVGGLGVSTVQYTRQLK